MIVAPHMAELASLGCRSASRTVFRLSSSGGGGGGSSVRIIFEVCLTVCLSVYLFVCLSVYSSISVCLQPSCNPLARV